MNKGIIRLGGLLMYAVKKVSFFLNLLITKSLFSLVFLTFFAPVAIILRLCRYDIMDLYINREKLSYWKKLGYIRRPESYYKQF